MTRRPPAGCPVCSERLQVTQLGCPSCGTGLTGAFDACEFCSLDAAQRDVLRVFLASRGNVRELERHLGVSYPTARARVDDLVRALGLAPETTQAAEAGTGSAAADPEPDSPGSGPAAGPSGPAGEPDPRLATLRAVAEGELGVDQARSLLGT